MKPIIDISYWQKPELINYDKLAQQIDGVILRAAYGVKVYLRIRHGSGAGEGAAGSGKRQDVQTRLLV